MDWKCVNVNFPFCQKIHWTYCLQHFRYKINLVFQYYQIKFEDQTPIRLFSRWRLIKWSKIQYIITIKVTIQIKIHVQIILMIYNRNIHWYFTPSLNETLLSPYHFKTVVNTCIMLPVYSKAPLGFGKP